MSIEMRGSFDFSKVKALTGLPAGLLDAGELIKDYAVANVAKESGDLAESAEVLPGDHQVAVKFTASYAAMEHEFYYYHHPHGGGANYLGGALTHRKGEALAKVADGIAAEL